MNYDPLVALVSMAPMKRLTEENAKKKSRWGNNLGDTEGIEKNPEETSKWGSENYKPYLPLPFVDFPPGLTPAQLDQFLREQRFDELTKKLNKGELEYADPDIRSPSPPPIYDKNGSRINTREARIKNSMLEEYSRLVEYLLKHVEGFVAPPNYKPIKKIRKIEIPIDEYPEYNFMGLIIGPRGCNHKRLEAESGAQISIRGKGTLKEGKKTDHQTEIEANMPKHVHISADTEESIEKAVSLIIPLLDPKHPQHEEHKRKGLEQLAIVNGINISQLDTLKCSFCGSTTHVSADCSENINFQNFKKPEIKCNLCGDHGHITLDCKLAAEKKNDQNNENTSGEDPEANSQNNNISSNINANNNNTTNSIMGKGYNPNTFVEGSTFIPPPPSDDDFNKKKKKLSPNKMEKQVDLEYQKMMRELTFSTVHKNEKKNEPYKKGNVGITQSPSSTNNKNAETTSNHYVDSYSGSGYGVKNGMGTDAGVTVPSPPLPFNTPPHYPPTLSSFITDKNGEINPNFIPLNVNNANNNTANNIGDDVSCGDGYANKNGNASEEVNKNSNLGTTNNNNNNNKSNNNSNNNASVPYTYATGVNSSVRHTFNTTNKNYPLLMNMPNPSNFPLGISPPHNLPLPMPSIVPPFFNTPWNSSRNTTTNSAHANPPFPASAPLPPLPMDQLFPQKYSNGWPPVPMNFFPDDPFINAPPPDCNPPPLPSENGLKEFEQDN